jgi:sugar lactone lactonase YvrE
MPPHRDTAKSVLINGLRYPTADDSPVVERSQLGVFVRKFIEGDAQYDTDDYFSARIYANLTGGIGIEDGDEGAHTDRFWFGVMDTRSNRMIGLPPLVHEPSSPQAGAARPIGVVGTQFYMAFDNDVYGWDDDTDGWHVTANALGAVPVNKSVSFDGRVWIPLGANGIDFVTETTPASGTLTVDTTRATPEAAALAIWNNTLYALATDGDLWSLEVGSTTWAEVQNSASVTLKLNTSETPKNLVTYFNRQGEPVLWAITDRAAYMFYESAVEWLQSNIVFPPHPDFGRSACVWRTGEDLWIAAGMDVVRQTTGNAIVPLGSGLSRDQGVPQDYRGTIVDIEPEISHLYALVGGTSITSSAYQYSAQFGSDGSGDGELSTPKQVAVDSNGDIYVADSANSRLQRFSSAGAYEAQATGLSGITGVAVDSSFSAYVAWSTDAVRKLDSSLATVWTINIGGGVSSPRHIATDGTHVYVCNQGSDVVHKRLCSTGAAVATLGSAGTGDGQFANPHGIAYSATTGNLYVVDAGNTRIQEITRTGTFVRKWGSSGTGNGQFTTPTGVAVDATGNVFVADSGRDDVQMFTSTGTFLRAFGSAGTGNGQFALPDGIAVEADGDVWVSDTQSGNDRIQKFVLNDSVSGVTSYPSLHAWPGTGWHGLWHVEDATVSPTWMSVSAADDHYRLWWGDSAGQSYWLKLYRGFENPNQARLAGTAEFAAEGFWLSSKFDAGMLGFRKLASRVDVLPIVDSISSTETFLIEYEVDDGGWNTLGTVSGGVSGTLGNNHVVSLSFGENGLHFETIRFKVTGSRGSDTTLSPFMRGMTFLFVKIPQPARSLIFTLIFPDKETGIFGAGRTGPQMAQEIDDLADSTQFFTVSYGDYTFDNCLFAGATGHDMVNGRGGNRVVSIVQLPTEAVS